MKFIALLVAVASVTAAADTVYVPGRFKSDGTYVSGHYKTAPNDTKLDNYSAKGNVNPYTGKTGTVDPYKLPAPTYTPPQTQKPATSCMRDLVTGKCL